ncbi:hypothetical protein GGTG_11147 [Gaeumannomyces tritici R3-111a-1]|uniref:Uncharacterized protein n=1 Tax=Gaeumannomyces tritici (strain R3-111a-1) TaxID=644352 RepID=J3PCC4_GAET3|nr:hypothetical protein GGTG_11147 [Gaeumannomyces tritici R3-111a-1]EJT71894.1 hypothetical protein GGTG_11147 [Gaeumannomyces tritici R3-111a-1]
MRPSSRAESLEHRRNPRESASQKPFSWTAQGRRRREEEGLWDPRHQSKLSTARDGTLTAHRLSRHRQAHRYTKSLLSRRRRDVEVEVDQYTGPWGRIALSSIGSTPWLSLPCVPASSSSLDDVGSAVSEGTRFNDPWGFFSRSLETRLSPRY